MTEFSRQSRISQMVEIGRRSTIGFIGSGVVGGSLSVALSQKGYAVVAASSRTFSSAESLATLTAGCTAYRTNQEVADAADVVFVTTYDAAIEPVASGVSWRPGQGVVHCSGAASLDVFDEAVQQGAVAGAFHPLQAFSSVENGVTSIPGTTFGIEGGPAMQEYLEETALALGGLPRFLRSEDKPLYHLTGVMMGNLLIALAAQAAQIWDELGIGRAEGVTALAPMIRQVSYNLESSGIPGAVAGPYARGDVGTVRKHLEALKGRAPEVLPLYCELALTALPFGREKGNLTTEASEEIRVLVERFKADSGIQEAP